MTPTDASTDKPTADDTGTGVAGLHSWRAMYIFVTVVFILWVVLLELLTRAFS